MYISCNKKKYKTFMSFEVSFKYTINLEVG